MIKQSLQKEKARIDQAINSSNHNLSYFYVSNKIICQPEVVINFFKKFTQYSHQQQETNLNQLINILKTISTNSYTIVQANDEFSKNCISYIIQLIPQYLNNFVIFNQLLAILELLITASNLKQNLVRKAFQKNIGQFYENKVIAQSLFSTINILKILYNSKVDADRQPKNMLIFNGKRGVQLSPLNKKQTNWIFANGLGFCCWIYIENINFGSQTSLPKIFTFYSANNGGIQCYLVDNKIYYRIIGSKYSEPHIGSNGVFLSQIQTKKWNFICIQQEAGKTFSKSKLNFYLNRNKPLSFSLDPPKISQKQKTKYIFFDNIYCKTSSFSLQGTPFGNQRVEQLNRNINSIQSIKSLKTLVFQQRRGKIYQRSGFGFCPNFIYCRSKEMNFKSIIPYFYLLSFLQQNKYPLLQQLLSIFISFLRSSSKNQHEAFEHHYLRMISQLICETKTQLFFNENTIKILLHIKHTITDKTLLDQYYSQFLWPLACGTKSLRQQQILQVLKNSFTLNVGHFSTLIGLDQMINTLLNLELKSFTCCEKHYQIAIKKFEDYQGQQHILRKNEVSANYLLGMIELYFQNPKISYAEEAYKLCRVLTLKLSPCLTLSLISLLKKVVSQKINEKLSEEQAKKILKFFAQRKVYLIFLQVIQNNLFAQIKAEATKFIYGFLMKKPTVSLQLEVSYRIAKGLSINQTIEHNSQLKESRDSFQQEIVDKTFQKSSKILKSPKVISSSPKNQFKAVGPQAPMLTNKSKGNKKFDFKVAMQINQQSQVNMDMPQEKKKAEYIAVMQEQKTIDPEVPQRVVLSTANEVSEQPARPLSSLKLKKPMSLSINTDKINQMYTFGGEGGQQLMVSQSQEQQELQKIRFLAKKCVAFMKGQELQQQKPKLKPAASLPSTRNKTLNIKIESKQDQKAKPNSLKLISEADQQQQYPSNKKSPLNRQPKSTKSNNLSTNDEQSLCLLYNSLMECCLGQNFYNAFGGTKIATVSVLNIFFSWIPQTDLQVKFLNDLQIILQVPQNMQIVTEMPQLYDFLLQLCYKALVFEQMQQKRLYIEKLENLYKNICSYIFRQNPNAIAIFTFIIDWSKSKGTEYHPKCLFLTCRYMILLLLESIEEYLIMNMSNQKIMQRNFQYLGATIECLLSFKPSKPSDQDYFSQDAYGRIILNKDFQMTPLLVPYFRSTWADSLICEKYLFLFKKFFCTQWYKRGYKMINAIGYDWIKLCLQDKTMQLQKQQQYYLKNHFLFSLIEINRATLVESCKNKQNKGSKADQEAKQAVWHILALVVLAEIHRQNKNSIQFKTQVTKSFLKSTKILSEIGLQHSLKIPILVNKVFNAVNDLKSQKNTLFFNLIVQEITKNYIPEWVLQGQPTLQILNSTFSQSWSSAYETQKKIPSDLFRRFEQKYSKIQPMMMDFIQNISVIMEQQRDRQMNTQILLEINTRINKNQFRKLWKQQRLFGGVWTHPQLVLQNDGLCNKTMFTYQKYRPSPFYKYKISKHLSKYKARYLLDPRLQEPQIAEKKLNQDPQKEHAQELFLYKAIYYSLKLSLGKSVLRWLKGDDQLQVIMQFKDVRLVNTLTVRNGHFGILNDKLVFVASNVKEKPSHLAIMEYELRKDKSYVKQWPLQMIKQINRRRFLNRHRGVQLSFIHGKSIFLQFNDKDIDQFCKKIVKMKNKCPNLISNKLDIKKIYDNLSLLKKWNSYEMSNFEYLMEINHLSGRSYSDVTQFPVFPWALINFGNKLSLSDPTNYRDLSLPMGALGNQQRAHVFAERYQMMACDQKGGGKFHYGTHYSSPGVIYHFLIRYSPFTEGSFLLQGGKFDFADRLFFSMADSYKNATSEYSDVRQLVPQMYTIPEVYLNLNKHDFGIMQNKKRVHNVQLPEWTKQNPYLYVSKMRRALQQSQVSSTIHNWIDLIFGYKQKGEEAVKNLNVFYYLTYEDSIKFQEVQNQKMVKALQTQILNFGQTPSQVFAKPHPQRSHLTAVIEHSNVCDPFANLKVYRPSKSKNLQGSQIQMNSFLQSGQSIIHMKWIKQSKLVFLRRNGQLTTYKWHSSPLNNKIPFQCAVEKQRKVQRVAQNTFDPSEFYDHSLKTSSFPVQFINSGNTIVLGGLHDGKLVLIDADTNHLIQSHQIHSQTISCMHVDSKQNFLITGDINGQVILWRIHHNHKVSAVQIYQDQHDQITSVFVSYQLRCFAVGSMDGSVMLYNIITGKRMRVYYHPKRYSVDHIIISTSPLACLILFCNDQSIIYCYGINGQLIQRIHEKDVEHFTTPILLRDSLGFEHISFGNEKGQIIIRTLPFLDDPKKHTVAKDAAVNRICVSKNGRFLVTGCSQGQLSVITDPNPIQK